MARPLLFLSSWLRQTLHQGDLRRRLERRPYARAAWQELIRVLSERPSPKGVPSRRDLLLFATIFPRLSCSFNLVEYRALLDHFSSSHCVSSGTDLHTGQDRPAFRDVLADYLRLYPRHRGRIEKAGLGSDFRARLFYTIFLSNIYDCLPLLEARQTPFVFKLYLGGEWCVGNPDSDRMLDRVLQSPQFRHVITVDPATRDYLAEKWPQAAIRASYQPGWMVDTETLYSAGSSRNPAPSQRICFVGMKSAPGGKNKGFDVFVETAKRLAQLMPSLEFHVVGNCDAGDADVSELGSRIIFHGVKTQDFFPGFYADMDLILSPNRPHLLAPGHLEGAPNVTNVEAGLCGCLVVMTDQSKLNVLFKPDQDLVVVPHDPAAIVRCLQELYADPSRMSRLARQGRERFREVCGENRILQPLFRVLEDSLTDSAA